MVSAANPIAAEAGRAVLAKGGNAVDAMVAVQLTLGLVEPQSSGLGGGAFLVYYDAAHHRLTTFDGRETAPMAATPTLFQDDKGRPLKFFDAVVGGRSVGVPGTPRLLFDVHGKYGRIAWNTLLRPIIDLARTGFRVSPRLHQEIADDHDRLKTYNQARGYFYLPDGDPLPAGYLRQNEDYARTLQALSSGGADAFYNGPIADAIVDTVRSAARNPGRAVEGRPRRLPHRGAPAGLRDLSRRARSAAWDRRPRAPSRSDRSSASSNPSTSPAWGRRAPRRGG